MGNYRQSKLPKLNLEQQKLYDESLPYVIYLAKNAYFFGHRNPRSINDFIEFVRLELISWVFNYRGGYLFKKYLNYKIRYAIQDFIRSELMQKLGESMKNVKLLIYALRETKRNGKSIEQVAQEKKVDPQLVKDLLDAYQASVSEESFDVVAGRKL